MSKKYLSLLLITIVLQTATEAQIGPRFGRPRYSHQPKRKGIQQIKQNRETFQPSVNISLGYGFPNIDKYEFPDFYNYYQGTATQTGPITIAVDYQFNRKSSIGLIITHGDVTIPYYDYNNSSTQALTGSLNNWSYMLNFVRYLPASKTITPYIRTAIGINSWVQNYTDASGNKIIPPSVPSDLAYQVGLGAKFKLSKNAGLFVEAGYGKYIISGGLSFKF